MFAVRAIVNTICGVLLAATPSAHAARGLHPAAVSVDSLLILGKPNLARPIVERHLAQARERGDSLLHGQMLVRHAILVAVAGKQRDALPIFDESIAIAESQRDTTTWMRALGTKGNAEQRLGNIDESIRLFSERLQLAELTGDSNSEGWARMALGDRALASQDWTLAHEHYRKSAAAFRRAGKANGELTAMRMTATTYTNEVKIDTARQAFQDVIVRARELNGPMEEAEAFNNLGVLESNHGDMGVAARCFRKLYDFHRLAGNTSELVIPANNLATALAYLGSYSEAATILDDALDICEENELNYVMGYVLVTSADVRLQQRRWGAAAALCRRVQALGDKTPVQVRSGAALRLAASLVASDSTQVAEAVLRDELGSDPYELYAPAMYTLLAKCLRRDNRLDDALAAATQAEQMSNRKAEHRDRVDALLEMSACCRAVGRADDALDWFARGAEATKQAREYQEGHEWREAFGGARVLVSTCSIVLHHPRDQPYEKRVEALFDIIQQFKARTLIDRITEPRHVAEPVGAFADMQGVSLHDLQTNVIADGEIVLDFAVGESESYLFAVTRDSCRVVILPGYASDLPEKIAIYCLTLGTPPNAAGTLPPALSSITLGNAILSGVRDLIQDASRIIFIPDAFFNAVPFATLSVDGRGDQLFESMEVVRVPSATVLKLLRSKAESVRKTASITALIPTASTELKGARNEVNYLQSRFENLTLLSGNVEENTLDEAFADCDIVHVAGHVKVDDEKPWQSGILLGREMVANTTSTAGVRAFGVGESARYLDDDPYLRAGQIASRRVPAQLAVLSGCKSALGRITSGEGVLGLTSAFLSAGVRTVVAALWEVDDRVTSELMKVYYDELANGSTVASALRNAQLAIRSQRETTHPFYWAGFVLVGEGGATFAFAEKPQRVTRSLLVAIVVGVALGGALLGLWRARTRKATLSVRA